MTSSPDTLAPGGIVADRYQIVAALGADGSGSVFHATDTRSARDVTLRLFAADAWDAEARARFGAEVRAAAAVEHPNVERVLELGTDAALGADFVVEERPRGETLATLLAQRGAPPRPLALRVLLEAAAGIAAGHRAGIVHGDLHPGNVFLARMEEEKRLRVRVVGLGMRRGRAVPLTGMPVAPRYAAPERLRRAGLFPASDVFSLGVMAYELLAGLPAQWNALLAAMARGQPAPIPSPLDTRPDLSPALAEVVLRALAAAPQARFADGAAFAAALAQAAEMAAPSPAAAAPVAPPPVPVPSSAPAPAVPPPIVPAAPSVQAEPVAPPAAVPAAEVPSPAVMREETPPAPRPSPPAPPAMEAPRPSRAKAPAVVATDLRDALYIPPEDAPPPLASVPEPAAPPVSPSRPAVEAPPAAIVSPPAAPARDPWSISSEARGADGPVSRETTEVSAPVLAASAPAAPVDADREILPVAGAPAREETPVPSPVPAPAVQPRRPRFGAQPQKPARSGRGMLVGGGLAAAAVVGLLVWKVGFGVGGPLSADAAVSAPARPRPAGASADTPATPVQAPAPREETPSSATPPPAASQKVAETAAPDPREQARAAEEERRRREAADLARRQEAQRQALAQAQQTPQRPAQQPAAAPPPQAPVPTPAPEPERTAQVAAAAPAAAPVRGPAAAPVSRYSPTRIYNAGEVDAAASLSNRAEVASALSRNPPAALNLGSTVSARVRFVVLESGRVDPASITVLDQTHDGVEDPARHVLARARYEPARVEGKAVKSYVTMPVTWRPQPRE